MLCGKKVTTTKRILKRRHKDNKHIIKALTFGHYFFLKYFKNERNATSVSVKTGFKFNIFRITQSVDKIGHETESQGCCEDSKNAEE